MLASIVVALSGLNAVSAIAFPNDHTLNFASRALTGDGACLSRPITNLLAVGVAAQKGSHGIPANFGLHARAITCPADTANCDSNYCMKAGDSCCNLGTGQNCPAG